MELSTLEALIVSNALLSSQFSDRRWQSSAVYRGSQILSDLSAELPWHAHDGGKNSGARVIAAPVRRDQNPGVLVRPDPFITRDEWIRLAVISLIWEGDCFLEKSMFVDGLPTIVRVLEPARMVVQWNTSRTRRLYTYEQQVRDPDTIDHLALNRLPGQERGTSPLRDVIIDGNIAADKFARDLFESGGIPSGKLMHPGKLTAAEATAFLENWETGQAGGRKTAVMSGGIDYEPIGLSPDAGQLLQSRAYSVTEVGRLLGIPSHLLNATIGVAGSSGSSLTYTNVQSIFRELIGTTVQPVYLTRLEEAASAWLPRGQSVMFSTLEFQRADDQQRFTGYQTAIGAGFLNVDEVRELEGRAPLPNVERVPDEPIEDARAIGNNLPVT